MSVKADIWEWKGSSTKIVGRFPTDQKGLCGKEDFLHIPEFTQHGNRSGKSIMLHVQVNTEKDVLPPCIEGKLQLPVQKELSNSCL